MANTNTREGATKAAPSKWWASTGFFTSVILFAAGAWGLNSADFDATVKVAVLQIYTLVGTLALLRTYIVTAKLNLKVWLSQFRTYEYLVAVLAGIIPNIPADADDRLFDLINAFKTGNVGIIISEVVIFAVFAYNIWLNRSKAKA